MEKLKKILTVLWNFLNSRIFVIILIVVLIMIGAGQCKRIIDEANVIQQHEQNISALTDSLQIEKRKNGELLVSIDGYLGTVNEMKTINKGLWDRIKGQDGKILSLTRTLIRLRQDSTDLAKYIDKLNVKIGTLTQLNQNLYEAPWVLPYVFDEVNYFKVTGRTRIGLLSRDPLELRHDTTFLVEFENQIDITYGQKIEKDKLRIYIQSAYPGFTVKSMEGVLINPEDWPGLFPSTKRHWFTGFGVGPNISTGWNVLEAKPALILGFGLHYNIYQW